MSDPIYWRYFNKQQAIPINGIFKYCGEFWLHYLNIPFPLALYVWVARKLLTTMEDIGYSYKLGSKP